MSKEDMSMPDAVLARSDLVQRSEFLLGTTKKNLYDGDNAVLENIEPQLDGDNTLSSAWVAVGLFRKNRVDGKQSILIYNKEDEPTFPN